MVAAGTRAVATVAVVMEEVAAMAAATVESD
jgi:hypothetical protein